MFRKIYSWKNFKKVQINQNWTVPNFHNHQHHTSPGAYSLHHQPWNIGLSFIKEAREFPYIFLNLRYWFGLM